MSSFTKKHSALVKSGLANMCAIYDEVVKKHTKIPKTGSELYEMLCVEIFGEDEPQSESQDTKTFDEESKTSAIQRYNQKVSEEESESGPTRGRICSCCPESESESEEEDDGRFPAGWMDSDPEESDDEEIIEEEIVEEEIVEEESESESESEDEPLPVVRAVENKETEIINKPCGAEERKDVSVEKREKISIEEYNKKMKESFVYKSEGNIRNHRLALPYMPDQIEYPSTGYCQCILMNGGLYTPCMTRLSKKSKGEYCLTCEKKNPSKERNQTKQITYGTYLQKRNVPISFVKEWINRQFGDRLEIPDNEWEVSEKKVKKVKKVEEKSKKIETSSDEEELEEDPYMAYEIIKTEGDYDYIKLKNTSMEVVEFNTHIYEKSTKTYYGIDECNQVYKNSKEYGAYFVSDECGEFVGIWDSETHKIVKEEE